jgi:hypothetical protein
MPTLLPNSTYLDFTSHGQTSAGTPSTAYGMFGAVTAAPTVNVALVLPRANDPTALLTGNWGTRQATLDQLNDSGALWSTYGATTADYTAAINTLNGMGITILGDAAGSDGYVTSQESRTIWVKLDATEFNAFFGTPWLQSDSTQEGILHFWNGSLSVPDGLNIAGLWFDTAPIWGTYPAVSDMSGGASMTPAQGPLSIGNDLYESGGSPTIYSGQMAEWFYDFPLTGIDVPTATIGLVEPGIGDAIPPSATYTFQQGFERFRANAGLSGPGDYYVVANNGQNYFVGNSLERSLDLGVVISAAPGSTIGLYSGSGFGNHAHSNAFTSYQAAFWDQTNDPSVISSSFSIFQQSSPHSPFAYAVRELFTDAALRNISVAVANNDWGSGWNFGNGLANQAVNVSSPYLLSIGGTSLSTMLTAPLDATISDDPSPDLSLFGLALSGQLATLWSLVAGGLKALPAAVTVAEAAQTLFLESVWNTYWLDGTTLNPQFGAGDGGVNTTQPIPWYQTAFGLIPTSANPDGGTGRGTPDVSANAGGNMFFAGPSPDMAPVPTPSGGYWGTSASTPLWASLLAQFDTIFQDQGLPRLGFANDLLYTAAAIAPASFNDITYGNNVLSFYYGGPIDNPMLGNITLTGYGYEAGPGYDLTTGLGSPNGVLLARALTTIAHSQMSYSARPDMLDDDGGGGWASGTNQSLAFQAMSASGVSVAVDLDDGTFGFNSTASSEFAWTNRFAQQVLQDDFDPNLVRLFDKQAQGWVAQASVASGQELSVSINGASAQATQGSLSSPFGFADFASGDGAVRVARSVAVAETANASDDQTAVVRVRQNGEDSLSLTFYRVDDLSGTITGIRPGEAGYARAAEGRAYQLGSGGTAMGGPGYGNYQQTTLLDVDAGDLIAMKLFNNDSGATFWAFAQANEAVGGQNIGHLWSYGLNTWGWEDTYGGGDRDFNDFIIQLDFTSTAGSGWLM